MTCVTGVSPIHFEVLSILRISLNYIISQIGNMVSNVENMRKLQVLGNRLSFEVLFTYGRSLSNVKLPYIFSFINVFQLKLLYSLFAVINIIFIPTVVNNLWWSEI